MEAEKGPAKHRPTRAGGGQKNPRVRTVEAALKGHMATTQGAGQAPRAATAGRDEADDTSLNEDTGKRMEKGRPDGFQLVVTGNGPLKGQDPDFAGAQERLSDADAPATFCYPRSR